MSTWGSHELTTTLNQMFDEAYGDLIRQGLERPNFMTRCVEFKEFLDKVESVEKKKDLSEFFYPGSV